MVTVVEQADPAFKSHQGSGFLKLKHSEKR